MEFLVEKRTMLQWQNELNILKEDFFVNVVSMTQDIEDPQMIIMVLLLKDKVANPKEYNTEKHNKSNHELKNKKRN